MATRNFLYKSEIVINDFISIQVPKVGEILDDNEDTYYNMVQLLTAMPIDMCVALDDIGIDFSKINDYELFLLMFNVFKQCDTRLIFGDFDLSPFELAVKESTGKVVLLDPNTEREIDRAVQVNIAETLRKLHHLEKNNRKPGNEEARKYMIKCAKTSPQSGTAFAQLLSPLQHESLQCIALNCWKPLRALLPKRSSE